MTKRTIEQLQETLDRIDKEVIEKQAELAHVEHRAHKIRAEIRNRLLAEPERAIPAGTDRLIAEIYRGYVYRYGQRAEGFARWNRLGTTPAAWIDDELDSDVIPEDEARIERELYGEMNVDLDELDDEEVTA